MVAGLIMGGGGGSGGKKDELDRVGEEGCSGDAAGGRQSGTWKMEGWVRWLEGLRDGYEWRMRTMCTILEEGRSIIEQAPSAGTSRSHRSYYDSDSDEDDEDDWQLLHKTPLYSFQFPRGGMFVWVRMCFETHPLWSCEGVSAERLSAALWKHLMKKPYLCLVAPGAMFNPAGGGNGQRGWSDESFRYFRLCFAPMQEGDVAASAKGFVEGCRDFWLQGVLEDDDDDDDE